MPSGTRTVAQLITAMRAGERAAAAEFLETYGPLVRRRVRAKLGNAMRRLFDTQEILSTVGRRLDAVVRSGRVRAISEAQLWSLVFEIADNSLIEKARLFRTLRTREGEDGVWATRMLGRMREWENSYTDGVEIELDAALRSLRSDADRQILSLWMQDWPLHRIAAFLEISDATVRKRWERIRGVLKERYQAEAC